MDVKFNDKKSLDRPAWTSEQSTGMFESYKHKHTIERGRFALLKNYYWRTK
jgi:hypothetical protein